MEARFVQAGDVRLQYFERGTGPETVVFVHGFTASGRIWRLAQEALDPNRLRTIALSNLGAGDSDRGSKPEDYSVESFARHLRAFVDAVGLDRFSLVGHSLGGATVTRFALDNPDRIRSLVLLNPVPLDGDAWRPGWREDLQAMFEAALNPAEPEGPNADFQRALQADTRRNPHERGLGGLDSMASLKLRKRLTELTMPVLVIGGDRDELVGMNNILAEYLALPPALRSLHIFHSIGHSPNVELPGRFAGVLTRFVLETATRHE